jgi:hypothetical protein
LSWSIWLYKDIGFQGMVHLDPNTPYMKLVTATGFLKKKFELSVDAWGATTTQPQLVKAYGPLEDLISSHVEEKYLNLYPFPVWKFQDRVSRLARNILVAEFLVKEWADLFKGKTRDNLEEIAKSFAYSACLKRDGLTKVLQDNAKLVAE